MKKKKNKEIKEEIVEEKKDDIKETLNELKETSEINPDLNEFFDAINEKKKELVEITEEKETVEEVQTKAIKKEHKFGSYLKNFICVMALLLSAAYLILYIKNSLDSINYIQNIINASTIFIILLFAVLAIIGNKIVRNVLGSFASLLVILLITFNVLVSKDIIKVPTASIVDDFKNVALTDVMKWASENKVDIETLYEYSDNVKEGYIITQDILPNTLTKKIKKIVFTVSSGPNYEKEVTLLSMVGMSINDLLDFIDKNHLNNVNISYTTNDEIDKDTIISQSIKGQIKRNSSVSFVLSLGNKDALEAINIEDLTNKSEFDATLYLMKNGITSSITYEYSDKIKRGYVISQDKIKNTKVTPLTDTVKLVISKGKKISVPDFTNKTVEDVATWASNNNLKVSFIENYDVKIANGKLININYKIGDIVEEGTKIIINISKGALVVPTFKSLAEFNNWASENKVNYSQDYQFNDSVSKGNIISLSIASGTKIDPAKDSIKVTISYGAPSYIPNLIGKSKGTAASNCNSAKINCSYYYTGYSNAAKDTVTTQSVGAGTKVVSGTYIRVGLSNGPAQTFRIYIQSEWIQSSADATIATIRANLTSNCPDVKFNFVKRSHNSIPAGFIHPDSPIQAGKDNNFTQGQTYTIIIVE